MVKNSNVVAISLFSGCGGLDIGSHLAGIPVISSIDFDEDSIKTLKQNKIFQDSKIIWGDVRGVYSKYYREIVKKHKSDKTILIGGPPCQPFSKAAYWIGNNTRKGEKDPRNMIGEYLRILKGLSPEGFLFENVESILHPTNKQVVEKIIIFLKKEKYYYKIVKANSLDYGVPQKRKRIFIIGSKKPFKTDKPKKTHFPKEIAEKKGLTHHVNVGEVISKFDNQKYFEPSELTKNGTYSKHLKEVPPGKNYIALSKRAGHPNPSFEAGKKFWNFLLKLHPDMPSWTIAAQPGPWVGPFHWTSRRLRIPEIAAIQSFPEDYNFYGDRRSVQKQIGNAVPPLMAKAMIEFLRENI